MWRYLGMKIIKNRYRVKIKITNKSVFLTLHAELEIIQPVKVRDNIPLSRETRREKGKRMLGMW